jgi:hypothetical protein
VLSCFLPFARASSPCAISEDQNWARPATDAARALSPFARSEVEKGHAQQLADSSFFSSAKKARSGGGPRRQNEPPATRLPRSLQNARARPTSSSRTLTTTICLCRAQARRRRQEMTASSPAKLLPRLPERRLHRHPPHPRPQAPAAKGERRARQTQRRQLPPLKRARRARKRTRKARKTTTAMTSRKAKSRSARHKAQNRYVVAMGLQERCGGAAEDLECTFGALRLSALATLAS